MKQYLRLHELIFNKPHLCTPEYAETVLSVLGNKLNIEEGAFSIQGEAKDKKESNVTNGVAHLPIIGSMVHRGSSLGAASGINSYQAIQSDIQEALENSSVKAIMLEMDSPGGSVAGAFDLRDFIMEAKKQKPIYAYAKDTMASAAYLIGSAATKVYSSQTGSIGSIGVVAMHVDQSEKNKQQGIKPTFIHAGNMKTAGNPHEPLEGEALNYLQESVNSSYEMFIDAVAEARGIDKQVIRDTEARVYRGQKAVELGLVDGVKSFDAVMEEITSNGQSGVLVQQNSRGMRMETDAENQTVEVNADAVALDDLKAKHEALQAAVIAEGYTITAEGINREEEAIAPDMIEVAGVMTDKASLPEHVVTALEANATEKAEAALKEAATNEFPNFNESAAVTLFAALEDVSDKEEVMAQLKAADAYFGSLTEEAGEVSVDADLTDPKEAMDALVKDYMETHDVTVHSARVQVAATPQGRELQKAIRKG
jgi:signal peptide peptidase SppA